MRQLITILVMASLACGQSVNAEPVSVLASPTPPHVANTEMSITPAAIDTPTPLRGTVIADVLEVRAGAGEQYQRIGYKRMGDLVTLLGNIDPATKECGGWLKIPEGYVCKDFVK